MISIQEDTRRNTKKGKEIIYSQIGTDCKGRAPAPARYVIPAKAGMTKEEQKECVKGQG